MPLISIDLKKSAMRIDAEWRRNYEMELGQAPITPNSNPSPVWSTLDREFQIKPDTFNKHRLDIRGLSHVKEIRYWNFKFSFSQPYFPVCVCVCGRFITAASARVEIWSQQVASLSVPSLLLCFPQRKSLWSFQVERFPLMVDVDIIKRLRLSLNRFSNSNSNVFSWLVSSIL